MITAEGLYGRFYIRGEEGPIVVPLDEWHEICKWMEDNHVVFDEETGMYVHIPLLYVSENGWPYLFGRELQHA